MYKEVSRGIHQYHVFVVSPAPAHNTPMVDPAMLIEVQQAFDSVLAGKAKPVPTWKGTVTFEFEGFGFLMRADYTRLPTR